MMCFFSNMAPLLGDTTGSKAFSPVIEHIIVACGGGSWKRFEGYGV